MEYLTPITIILLHFLLICVALWFGFLLLLSLCCTSMSAEKCANVSNRSTKEKIVWNLVMLYQQSIYTRRYLSANILMMSIKQKWQEYE